MLISKLKAPRIFNHTLGERFLQLIEHSLACLVLGFILGRSDKTKYVYQVPLFREMVLNESLVSTLKIEMNEWYLAV